MSPSIQDSSLQAASQEFINGGLDDFDPSAPPPFRIAEIRAAIPKHCWIKNPWRSLSSKRRFVRAWPVIYNSLRVEKSLFDLSKTGSFSKIPTIRSCFPQTPLPSKSAKARASTPASPAPPAPPQTVSAAVAASEDGTQITVSSIHVPSRRRAHSITSLMLCSSDTSLHSGATPGTSTRMVGKSALTGSSGSPMGLSARRRRSPLRTTFSLVSFSATSRVQ